MMMRYWLSFLAISVSLCSLSVSAAEKVPKFPKSTNAEWMKTVLVLNGVSGKAFGLTGNSPLCEKGQLGVAIGDSLDLLWYGEFIEARLCFVPEDQLNNEYYTKCKNTENQIYDQAKIVSKRKEGVHTISIYHKGGHGKDAEGDVDESPYWRTEITLKEDLTRAKPVVNIVRVRKDVWGARPPHSYLAAESFDCH